MDINESRPLLRKDPKKPDSSDALRIAYSNRHWDSQTESLFLRDRQVEDNLRMLAGHQWGVWSDLLNRYLDVSEWMTEDERMWRQRPVLNRLILWFILTHARMTENPPIVGWLPGPDRVDAELAESLDTLMKAMWRQAGMVDTLDNLASWLIPCGEVYGYSRIDPSLGELREWTGMAQLDYEVESGPNRWEPLVDEMGNPFSEKRNDVPFDAEGNPTVRLTIEGMQPILGPDGQPVPTHADRDGEIVFDIVSLFQVRGQWGHHIPWHRKRWHRYDRFLLPEEIYDLWGVKAEPDTLTGSGQEATMNRVLFGPGYFGSASRRGSAIMQGIGLAGRKADGYVRVSEFWERPAKFPGMEERKDYAGGRLLIHTREAVLYDGPRPVAFRYTSPIRQFQFIRVPGRPAGTSLQEFMNSPQRSSNRMAGQSMEYNALASNPKKVVANGSGLEHLTITNRPDETYAATVLPGVPPIQYISPPPVSSDNWKLMDLLSEYMTSVGNVQASPGETPSTDPSAKLVQELRFDRDRFLGPTLRRLSEEIARMQEDWLALMPLIFPEERMISDVGEDNIARAIMLRPEMLKLGKVDAQAAPESALPETRGERIARARQAWIDGLFGEPTSPEAITDYAEVARFPHSSRVMKPGGPDRVMAEQNIGKILQGTPAQEIPLFAWYNLGIHRMVFERFMKGPEFLKLAPPIQEQFATIWTTMSMTMQLQQEQAIAEQAATEALAGGPVPAPQTAADPAAV